MIREVPGRKPRVHPDAYVDPQAAVIGDVCDNWSQVLQSHVSRPAFSCPFVDRGVFT